jgi:sterol desaturase/sphingolipid hydroxylase (fatty acid hydroxylase superfamily)
MQSTGFIASNTTLRFTSMCTSLTTGGLVCVHTSCRSCTHSYVPLVPTPFASFAFHPLDGFLQSIPYHFFIFVFPLHRWVYIGLFVFVNFWTILIHDSDMITGHPLEKILNGPAHHTLHHLYFTVNYGQVR